MKLFRSIQAFGTCRFPDVLIEQLTEDPSVLKLGMWNPGEIDISVLSANDLGDAIEVDIVLSCCPVQGAGCCAIGPDVDQVKRILLKIDKAQGCAIGFE